MHALDCIKLLGIDNNEMVLLAKDVIRVGTFFSKITANREFSSKVADSIRMKLAEHTLSGDIYTFDFFSLWSGRLSVNFARAICDMKTNSYTTLIDDYKRSGSLWISDVFIEYSLS